MESSINVNFKYTEAEYVDALKWYYIKSSSIKFDFIIAIILLMTSCFLWFIDQSVMYIVLIIISIVFLLILIYVIYINPVKIFRKEPKFRGEYYLSFSSEGIVFKTKDINSTLKWNHYVKFEESKRFFYLIYGRFMLTIVPKRAFELKSEEEGFKKLLITKLMVE